MNTKTQKKLSQDGTIPYQNLFEHLTDELRWLNRIILIQVLRLRQRHFYEKLSDFRDLFISDEEVDALLAAGVFENDSVTDDDNYSRQINILLSQAEEIRHKISQRITASQNQNIFLPLVRLQQVFGLSEFEIQSLIICLAPQIDSRYEKLYAYLQNDLTKKYSNIDLILNMQVSSLTEKLAVRDSFSFSAPLIKFKLLEFIENGYDKNGSLLSKMLKINDRIVGYIIGSRFIDYELEPIAQFYYSEKELSELIIHEELKKRLKNFLRFYKAENNKNRQSILFSFYGPYGVGKQEAAGAFCHEIDLPLLIIDLEAILNLELPFDQTIENACRESLLVPAVLYFKNTDAVFNGNESTKNKNQFLKIIDEKSWLTFIGSHKSLEEQVQIFHHRFIEVEFPVPDYALRQLLWRTHLNNGYPTDADVDFNTLAGKFNLTGGQIYNAITSATNRSLWKNPTNEQIKMQDLIEGCHVQSNQKLKTLAQKIRTKYRWADIVLPYDQMSQLREITNYVKYKHVVYGDWGFDQKLSLGKGLNILFSGPSGTGKTMASDIIANELDLDLYKIDLSTIVSKYIGETEKNLNKIFKEAEASNAILFFDEADALFGKRSEVKDAHDRYANIEIGYLLQKMDEYTGVVILATNLRKNMDEAFVRRMHFTVEFPFPEEEYRLSIWQNIFPKETPLANNIDFNFLARKFKVSGGNIKNIALAAAFYAADNGLIVTMEHLMQATRRELQKKGKLCVKADFEDYYELVQN